MEEIRDNLRDECKARGLLQWLALCNAELMTLVKRPIYERGTRRRTKELCEQAESICSHLRDAVKDMEGRYAHLLRTVLEYESHQNRQRTDRNGNSAEEGGEQ